MAADSFTCRKCRRLISEGKCKHCHSKTVCLNCGAQLNRAMLRCRDCGAAIARAHDRPPSVPYVAHDKLLPIASDSESTGLQEPVGVPLDSDTVNRTAQPEAAVEHHSSGLWQASGTTNRSAEQELNTNGANGESQRSVADSGQIITTVSRAEQVEDACRWGPSSSQQKQWYAVLLPPGIRTTALAVVCIGFASVIALLGTANGTTNDGEFGSDVDRLAANWVMDHFGVVQVKTPDGEEARFVAKEHLPAERFVITEINLKNQEINESELDFLPRLRHLETLDLSRTASSDIALKFALRAPSLSRLYMLGTNVTRQGFEQSAEKTQMYSLSVSLASGIDDLAVAAIVGKMPGLRFLSISGTNVSDQGLNNIAGLNYLRVLQMPQTNATETGVSTLAAALPDCEIRTN